MSLCTIGINDFKDVWCKVGFLSDRWDSIGLMLGISIRTIKVIEDNHPRNNHRCLREVLTHWLQKDYDYESNGNPSWLTLRDCIKSKNGGNDIALAVDITKEHLASADTARSDGNSPLIVTSPKDNSTNVMPSPSPALPVSKSGLYVVKRNKTLLQPLTLQRKIEELQLAFADNLLDTKKKFQSCPLHDIIEYIDYHIVALLSPRMKNETEVQTEFEQVQSIPQLFKILKKYVSWFNFEFIVTLVSVFMSDNRELVNKWSAYREKLKDYFTNDSNQAIQVGDDIEFGLTDVPGTKIMIVKVARDDYRLNDLYFFHKAIADALEIPEYPLYFCCVGDGCMELKYSIPEFVCSVIFPLTNQQCYSLAKLGITKLTCEEYVYEIQTVSYAI